MRQSLIVVAALLLAACSKSPEGLYVTAGSALRVYREGDGFFIELHQLDGPRPSVWKPRVTGRLERTESFWVGKMSGLGDELTLTLTSTGLIATANGIKRVFPRVAEAPPAALDSSQATAALRESLVAATSELTKSAQVKVVSVTGLAAGPWFDGYSMEGTLELEALELDVPDAPVCVQKSAWGGSCGKWGTGAVVATAAQTTLPFRAQVVVSRYPAEMAASGPAVIWTELAGSTRDAGDDTVCHLLRHKALAYAERAAR